MSVESLKQIVNAAVSRESVDLLFTNAQIVDVYGLRVVPGEVAVSNGVIVGVLFEGESGGYEAKRVIDCEGR